MGRIFESVRSVLGVPAAYRLWWKAIGGPACFKTLVSEYVPPGGDNRILEIGCGPGTILPFLAATRNYVGFDLNSSYIEQARARFPQAQFVCAPVSQYTLAQQQSFDTVLAIGVVHHLDNEEATRLFQIAYDALKPGGKLVTFDGVLTNEQPASVRWMLSRDRGKFVRSEPGYVELASQVFTTIASHVRNDLLRIPYTHLILECVR